MNTQLPSLKDLLRRAFVRTKERFRTYFLISLLFGAVVFVFGILVPTAMVFAKPFFLLILFPLMIAVFSSWFITFMQTVSLIHPDKQGVKQTFAVAKPLFRGYLWMMLLMILFFIGLIPLGIVTLLIVFLLWSFWSIFSVFIYFEHRKKGLESLWLSREMMRGRFWQIAWRVGTVVIGSLLLSFLPSLIGQDLLQGFFSVVYQVVAYPFIISFLYEVYKPLPVPNTAARPTRWIVISAVGFINSLQNS